MANVNYDGQISVVKVYTTALTADEVKELYSGASVPFKYKGASQTSLNSSTFIANVPYGMTSTSGASSTGITAGSDGAGLDAVNTTASLVFVAGKRYRVSFTGTINSGTAPTILIGDAINWGTTKTGMPQVAVTAGANIREWTSTHSGTFPFIIYLNGTAGNFTIADFSITQIGAVAEYDGGSATAATWYDKSGNFLDGTVTGASFLGNGSNPPIKSATAPSSPTAGDQWFNTSTNVVSGIAAAAMASYSGAGWDQMSNKFSATGGTESTYSSGGVSYKVHTFTSSSTFASLTSGTVDVLIVAGGGPGGYRHAGGGGAGGVIHMPGVSLSEGSYSVVIGAGGTCGVGPSQSETQGNNSTFINETCNGGGPGGSYQWNLSGVVGGSGGGACGTANPQSGSSGNQGNPSSYSGTGYGNGGGHGYHVSSPYWNHIGGGGGGAGAVGGNAGYTASSGWAGEGGNGVQIDIDGNNYYWGGGGGGSTYSNSITGNGGLGGGGGGSANTLVSGGSGGSSAKNAGGSGGGGNVKGGNGGANTGGGGGGGAQGRPWDGNAQGGGNGGSGCVIVRYTA
jgi:hypothetical protein